jgi:hypothetical protein
LHIVQPHRTLVTIDWNAQTTKRSRLFKAPQDKPTVGKNEVSRSDATADVTRALDLARGCLSTRPAASQKTLNCRGETDPTNGKPLIHHADIGFILRLLLTSSFDKRDVIALYVKPHQSGHTERWRAKDIKQKEHADSAGASCT